MVGHVVTTTDERRELAAVGKRRRRSIDQWLMDVFGHEWCGNSAPPLGGHRSIYVEDDGVTRVFSMQDDGGFVGIGYPDQWHVIMRTKAARLFAWWTFKVWAADWFGLRSFIYYRALHHRVEGKWRWHPYARRTRRRTRLSSYDEWRAKEPRS